MATQKSEGLVTSRIEDQTRRIPTGGFLLLAFGSIAASAFLMLSGRKAWANFVGQWAPTLLILGTYNRLVKTIAAPYGEEPRQRYGQVPIIQSPSEVGRASQPQPPLT